jgi:hypothetical protein
LLAQLRESQTDERAGGGGGRLASSTYNAPTYEAGDAAGDAAGGGGGGPRLGRFPGDGGFTDPEERGRFGRAEVPAFQGALVAASRGLSGGGLPAGSEEENDSDAELDAMMNDLEAEGGALAR